MVLQLIVAAAVGAFMATMVIQNLIKVQSKKAYRALFEIADKCFESICEDNTKGCSKEISMEDIEKVDTNLETIYNMALQYNPEAAERIRGNVLKVRDEALEDLQEKEKKR